MPRNITRCAEAAALAALPVLSPESTVTCRVCGEAHHVDWEQGWAERMHDFCDHHSQEHGAFQFGIRLRP
jgi:hypothetical protein